MIRPVFTRSCKITDILRNAICAVILLAVTATVSAQNIDLSNFSAEMGTKYFGNEPNSGESDVVAPIGDFNGDGIDDLIIGSPVSEIAGKRGAGKAYVVFGSRERAGDFDLSITRLDNNYGFKITGTDVNGFLGIDVSSAGDFNGDGFDDVVVGSWMNSAFVIYGRPGISSDLSVSDLEISNTRGFRITGINPHNLAGQRVSYAGDINNDERGDIVIISREQFYVIFGRSSVTPNQYLVDFVASDTNGYSITGHNSYTYYSNFATAGDFNGDGFDDIIVGGIGLPDQIIYGKARGFKNIFYNDPSPQQNTIISGSLGFSGARFGEAADFNGDGFSDLIIGGPGLGYNGSSSRSVFVVFGRAKHVARLDLNTFSTGGPDGFRIDGVESTALGSSACTAGDINQDGYFDLIMSAPFEDFNGRENSGCTYVLYGRPDLSENINLAVFGVQNELGFRIDHPENSESAEAEFPFPARAGDINGDGVDDYMIHQIMTTASWPLNGETYVLYGVRGTATPGNPVGNPLTGTDFSSLWALPNTNCKTSKKGVTKCTVKSALLVTNTGTGISGNARVHVFLSSDQHFDALADQELKTLKVGKLKPQKSKTLKLQVKLAQPATGKYLIALLDADNTVVELNEGNNMVMSGPLP